MESLLSNTALSPGSGCMMWLGSDSGTGRGGGYPKVRLFGTTHYVHRLIWELANKRPVPPGCDVDHLCARWTGGTSRLCIREDHLEAVPAIVNQRRKVRNGHS